MTPSPRAARLRELFPEIEPYFSGKLRVSRLHTLHYEARFEPAGWLGISPFAELTLGTVQDEGQGLFSAEVFYGGDTSVTSLMLGFRMDLGGAMPRMGRYGVVAEPMNHSSTVLQGHTH